MRDSNKLVSAAVLSSPKLTSAEVEAFTKMGNVSEDVLRIIGQNRAWTKNYNIMLGLCRHPKTPPAIVQKLNAALQAALKDPDLVKRFNDISTDPMPDDRATPAAAEKMLLSEIDRWAPIIQASGQYAD